MHHIVLLFHQTMYFFVLCSLNLPFKIGKTVISWKKRIPTTNSNFLAISNSLVKICCGTPLPADHSFFNLKLESCVAFSLFHCLYGMYFYSWQLQQAFALKHTLFEGKWLKIEGCYNAKNEQTILAFAQRSVFSQDDSQLKQEFFVPLLLRYVNKKIQFPYLYEKSDEFPIFNQCCTRGRQNRLQD